MKFIFSIVKKIVLGILIFFCTGAFAEGAASFTGKWVWSSESDTGNTWMAFRKSFNIVDVPTEDTIAHICAESRYYLWINDTLVVREGNLKGGPHPNSKYYDSVDIQPYLRSGDNTIAVLVNFWGKAGHDTRTTGEGGLLFQSDISGMLIKSDNSWKVRVHPAFSDFEGISQFFSECNIAFDARLDIPDWYKSGYDDSSWQYATEKGNAGEAPFGPLYLRTLPQFRYSPVLSNYLDISTNLTSYSPITESTFPIVSDCKQYFLRTSTNNQLLPYLSVTDPVGGQEIYAEFVMPSNEGEILTVRHKYITKASAEPQEFEGFSWITSGGDRIIRYTVPLGITINAFKYRQTDYDIDFRGSFHCSDPFYDSLWIKSRRTAMVNMRDTIMGCADRERAGWMGDQAPQFEYIPYAFESTGLNGYQTLVRKCIEATINFQMPSGGFCVMAPTSASGHMEYPSQELVYMGEFGVWNYYLQTGDASIIKQMYEPIKRCLAQWSTESNGLLSNTRAQWWDWGEGLDTKCLESIQYYSVIKHLAEMAVIADAPSEASMWTAKADEFRVSFNQYFWDGFGYRTPCFGNYDDRANAWAVCLGLADRSKYSVLRDVLLQNTYASPQMERYPFQALVMMGYPSDGLARVKQRFGFMVEGQKSTETLWEFFADYGVHSSKHHGYGGASLKVLSAYIAGIRPLTPGYEKYSVLPSPGSLSNVKAVVPSVAGDIKVIINNTSAEFSIELNSPVGTTAVVGIPKNILPTQIKANGKDIWIEGKPHEIKGVTYDGESEDYIKFRLSSGKWFISSDAKTQDNEDGSYRLGGIEASTTLRSENAAEQVGDGCAISGNGWISTFHSAPEADEWIMADLKSIKPVSKLVLVPRTWNSHIEGFPADFVIEYSNDKVSWTPIPGQVFTDYQFCTKEGACFVFSKIDVRYLRIRASKLNQTSDGSYYFQLAEILAYENNLRKGESHQIPSATASSVLRTGSEASRAIDSSIFDDNGWISKSHADANATESISFNFGTDVAVDRVVLYPRTWDCAVQGFPVDFHLEYKNSVTGSWVLIPGQAFYNVQLPDSSGMALDFAPLMVSEIRVVATRLGSSCGAYYFQLGEFKAYCNSDSAQINKLTSPKNEQLSDGLGGLIRQFFGIFSK